MTSWREPEQSRVITNTLDCLRTTRTPGKRGEKVSYIVAVLAERNNVSERKVYDIVKRLGSDCKLCSP